MKSLFDKDRSKSIKIDRMSPVTARKYKGKIGLKKGSIIKFYKKSSSIFYKLLLL